MHTILIVDDNATLLRFTRRNVEMAFPGVRVVTAGCGRSALETAAREAPSVVIVDQMLPDTTGLDLLEELRRVSPAARAIVVTASLPDTLRGPARERGAVEVLSKPCDADELTLAIGRALLGSSASQERAPASNGALPDATAEMGRRHRVRNSLNAVLAGLRAFGAELGQDADDPAAVRRLSEEYVERLVEAVLELADLLVDRPEPADGSPARP